MEPAGFSVRDLESAHTIVSEEESNSKRKDSREAGQPPRTAAREYGERLRSVGILGSIPIILAAGPIVGVLIGQWLDGRFGTDPWLAALMAALGFAAGVREMIRLIRRSNAEEKKADQDKRES